jgi:2,4-dienoyl-CoA reductase (NADPH2)
MNASPGIERFPNLFGPRKIGRFTAPNSVKYAACSVSNFNNLDGSLTEREFARMETICRTGAGLITNQGAYPDAAAMGKAYFRQISLADDRFLPGFERIAKMIHDVGALGIQQILHGGRYGGIESDHCLQPSEVPQTLPHFRPPRRMTKEQIRDCIRDHVAASQRASRAGFDGVEITAFMGYLLANFLSPFTNDRTDDYGGSFENRGRFMVELIQAVKNAIQDKMLWIRLNATELLGEQGNSDEECLGYMKMAEAAGADGISIVIGWHESRKGALARDLPSDRWLPLAANAKKELTVPVAFGPRFGDPLLAEAALAEGKFDFWEVCRPFLADPDLLNKARENRIEEVKPCIGGLTCLSRMFRNLPYVCSMNPVLGHEYEPEYRIVTTRHPKKVFVVGGGPSGMEAALTAVKKGHQVTLFEQREDLGGQLRAAAMEIGGGHVFDQLIDYYRTQIQKYGIEVHMNTRVDRSAVAGVRPDVVIVATGARIDPSPLSGLQDVEVIYADRFTEGDIVQGKEVVAIGGDRAGLVVAERLAKEGNRVTVVDQGKKLAHDVIPTFRWRHVSWVKELGIELIRDTRAVSVVDGELRLEDLEGKAAARPFDVLVVSGPRVAANALTRDLGFSCDELYTVGDAISPRNICEAVHEGYRAGVRV